MARNVCSFINYLPNQCTYAIIGQISSLLINTIIVQLQPLQQIYFMNNFHISFKRDVRMNIQCYMCICIWLVCKCLKKKLTSFCFTHNACLSHVHIRWRRSHVVYRWLCCVSRQSGIHVFFYNANTNASSNMLDFTSSKIYNNMWIWINDDFFFISINISKFSIWMSNKISNF